MAEMTNSTKPDNLQLHGVPDTVAGRTATRAPDPPLQLVRIGPASVRVGPGSLTNAMRQ